MADVRLNEQPGARDLPCHEQGILAFDRLVVVAIDNPDRHSDGLKLFCGKVRLRRPHLGDFIKECLVLVRRWRKLFILLLRPRDKTGEDGLWPMSFTPLGSEFAAKAKSFVTRSG